MRAQIDSFILKYVAFMLVYILNSAMSEAK